MDFKPKLVAFDLDGTLAESKQRVSAEMGELLGDLLKKIPVAVMSGAGLPQFKIQFLPAFPVDASLEKLYLFPTNAAQCFTYTNGTWTAAYDESFTLMEREKIMRALETALAASDFATPPSQVWGDRIEDRGAQISFSSLGQKAPIEAKKEWNFQHNDQRKQLQQTLLLQLPDFSVVMGGLTTIDITHKGINKAYGIRKLVTLTDISVSEMLYVGDALEEGGNDYVVVETGVRTHSVFGPTETAKLIESLL